ncbi:hypothetical protein R6242_19790 [Iodobacter sp. CM08]|uniref:hypothetical protein n=1 Tax=Iodobacter sp. CM08 TaxID=3085902 RepID=UPI002982814D|nr:hypothetical protein [Iodobacter sp. CM08]MDW5418815.1 hypothetical protein [Iodobacter sp. CM08]
MLGTMGLFGGLFAGWWLLLWWGLPISFQKMSPTAMLLTHLAPPLILGVVWRIWQRVRESRIVQAQTDGQAAAEAERVAQREAARQQHYAALAERQIKVLCRGVWGQALPVKDEPTWLEELPDGAHWKALARDELAEGSEDDLLGSLQLVVQQVLEDVYAAAPGAAWLPHYFEVNPQSEGREQLAMLKQAQLQAINAQEFAAAPEAEPRFFPGSGALMSRVQQLFQQDSGLPGMVIYAADAPLLVRGTPEHEWDELKPDDEQQNKWQGMPGYAAVAMVFLRENLPVPEALPAQEEGESDAYTPYWEKQQHYGDERWGRVPLQWQDTLAQLPVLAELRLSEQATIVQKQLLPMTRQIHTLFDNALVNAGLRDYPFSNEDKDEAKDQAESIAWLVHNSGDVGVGGTRLAALSSALQQYAVPVNAIDDASNSVREWGDVGSARSVLQTAIAVIHSARLEAPAVLVEFERLNETEHFSVALIRPQEQAA